MRHSLVRADGAHAAPAASVNHIHPSECHVQSASGRTVCEYVRSMRWRGGGARLQVVGGSTSWWEQRCAVGAQVWCEQRGEVYRE
jgi:hypothetical protein